MVSPRWLCLTGVVLLVAPLFSAAAQEGSSGPRSDSGSARSESTTNQKATGSKSKHADDFLVRGTVFTPEGLSFPMAEIRIRRSSEKKFRWEAYTNSRGEFAIRVKRGSEYEVVAAAKGFKDQTKQIDTKTGGGIEEMSFRMERKGEKKP